MSGADPFGDGRFEALDHRSLSDQVAAEDLDDRRHIVVVDRLSPVRDHQIVASSARSSSTPSHCSLVSER